MAKATSTRKVVQTELLARLAAVEARIAKLRSERDAIMNIIASIRSESDGARAVTRKNAVKKLNVEAVIIAYMQTDQGSVKNSKDIYKSLIRSVPNISDSTFRSHLFRMKEAGIIEASSLRGSYKLKKK